MGRSHTAIALGVVVVAVSYHWLPLTAPACVAAALGGLAPDIDTPVSTLGRVLPFISAPLYAAVGHRTATHGLIAISGVTLGAVVIAQIASNQSVPCAFWLGYTSHILGDLLTREGVALYWPVERRRRYSMWPRVRTGGVGELVTVAVLLLALSLAVYAINPGWVFAQATARYFKLGI